MHIMLMIRVTIMILMIPNINMIIMLIIMVVRIAVTVAMVLKNVVISNSPKLPLPNGLWGSIHYCKKHFQMTLTHNKLS